MLKALRLQIPDAVLLGNANYPRLVSHFADAGNRRAIDSFRQARGILRSNREEQFEVFATVQGQRERIKRAPAADPDDVFVKGKGSGLKESADVALVAQMLQIG